MARKTFVSYKYSEARDLRDSILEALGEDARFYKGETSDSPDMTDKSTDYIKEELKEMIYSTSVTIVIISPNMKQSKWIDWEIEYSLKQIKRGDKTSSTNGIIGVVMKDNGSYSWLRSSVNNEDGHTSIVTKDEYLYKIISDNRFNQNPQIYSCEKCRTVNPFEGSYISLVSEEDFLNNPNRYIENAYDKSKRTSGYKLSRQR